MCPAISSHDYGQRAEQLAHDFLQQRGLKLITRNYRFSGGEIDLVMQDGQTTVFVEVRARQSTSFVDPVETIGPKKVQRLILAGQRYLQDTRFAATPAYRFDVLLIRGSIESAEIEWIPDVIET